MSTVTLTIKADGKEAVEGLSQVRAETDRLGPAADKSAKQAGRSYDEMARRARAAGLVVAGVVTTVAAGLALMVRQQINTADASMKMAQASGVTVEAFSGMAHAAKLAGIEQGQLAQLMQATTRQAVEAATGTGRAAEAYAAMGISVRDQEGRLKSADVLLQEIGGKLRQLPDGAEKTALAIATLGRSGAEAIPLLNSNIAGLVTQAERLGLVFTEDTAKAAETFNDNITILGASVQGFANQIVRNIVPSLVQLSNQSVEAAESQNFLARAADFISDTFKGSIVVVMGMVDGVRLLADVAFSTATIVIEAFSQMGTAVAREGLQIGRVIAAIASRDVLALQRAVAGVGSGVGSGLASMRATIERELGLIGQSYNRTIRDTEKRMAALFAPVEALQAPTRQLVETFGYMAEEMEDTSAAIEEVGESSAAAVAGIKGFADAAKEAAAEMVFMLDDATELENILRQFDNIGFSGLIRDMEIVKAALADATDPATVERLQNALGALRQEGLVSIVGTSQQVLSSMQGMAKEGSNAYKAMEVASQSLNLVMAIGAVLNQGKGDPYTAFARMAAMAAAVAGLVGSIGSFGGGSFTDTAGQRQETQGTGTVLGDASAQSASIANATQITADATSALVGLNRGMLRALQQLNDSIGSATGMLARGSGQGFSDLPAAGRFGGSMSGVLDPFNLLGGSRRITDQGIVIVGDILEGIIVGAYQEVQSRSWRFGRRRTSEEVVPVADELNTQFGLIIDSIVGAVRAGAETLGLLPDEIQAAIEAFRIEETRISLMDLSSEDQQRELQAVFSSIFDNLAGSVVPFIGQFQRVGEGLGETLARVATGVMVTREAMEQLGLAIDETDPERFAQISEGLIDMAGGIEEFISGMLAFVDAFAPEAHRFAIAERTVTEALAQFGLELPATRDGMWELMQSLDATTEAGRAQIAILLQVAGAADTYYRALERQAAASEAATQASEAATREAIEAAEAEEARIAAAREAYGDAVGDLGEQLLRMGASDFAIELRNISQWSEQTRAELNRLAREAGRAAAAESDLSLVHEIAARRAAAAIAVLQASAEALARRLTGTDMQGIEDQIREMEAAQQSSFNSQISGIGDVGNAAAQMYQQQLQALQQITGWMESHLLSSLSTLTNEQQRAEALRQFEAAAAAAPGDASAAAALPGLADTLLQMYQGAFASGTEFVDMTAFVRETMASVAGALGNATAGGPPMVQLAPGWSAEVGGSVSTELRALYAERDAMLAEQQAAEQLALWTELSVMVASLIAATGEPLEAVLAGLRLTQAEMAAGIGINEEDLADYIDGLTQSALITELGALVDIHDLTVDSVDQLIQQTGILESVRDELERIAAMTAARNDAEDLPSFDTGISRVPSDMRAQIHQGEMVIDPDSAAALRRYGIRTQGVGGAELINEVRALRQAIERTENETRDTMAQRLDRVADRVQEVASATRQSGQEVAREVREGAANQSGNRRG